MARLLLSKATLSKQRQQLKAYQRYLPSLEMKRQQLMAARKQAQEAIAQLQKEQSELDRRVAEQMPMLAAYEADLSLLCQVRQVSTRRRNIVGVWVDEIDVLEFDNQPIPLLGRPHWIAPLQRWLQSGMALRLRIDLAHRNEAAIAAALRKVTQRVNLFDKVLIPETLANIRRIRIFLDDKDREAVVTSKIAKGKHAQNEVAV